MCVQYSTYTTKWHTDAETGDGRDRGMDLRRRHVARAARQNPCGQSVPLALSFVCIRRQGAHGCQTGAGDVDELARGHVRRGSNDTHWHGVAATGLDLLTVRDGLVGVEQAEVDEVVGRSSRWDLTGSRVGLTILFEASGDDLRIKS